MYKTYFRQAVGMLKQNPFISVISILGTALAIMMIMTMIVTFQIKNASVAPEAFRDRTLYLVSFAVRDTSGGNKSYQSYGGLPYDALKNYIVPAMKTPELVVATVDNVAVVKREGAKDALYQSVRGTDADYWKLYTHTFTAGKPYAREDFESGIRTAVLSETMAKMLFKGEDPIGKNIEIDFNSYRVTGIVRNVSPLFQEAYSEVWIPYTASPGYERSYYDVMLLARNTADFPKIREEVNEAKRKLDFEKSPKFVDFAGPRDHRALATVSARGTTSEQISDYARKTRRRTVFLFAVMLLVPALNLSGFSLSRIRKRMAEIGIRKAFGAKRHVILIQVLYENLITTLIGGIIGLGLSYGIVFGMRKWLLGIPADGSLPLNALVSGTTFLAIFVVCLVLNLISAGAPAYRASRMNIVDSLHQNNRK